MEVRRGGQAGQIDQLFAQLEESQAQSWFRGIPPERVGLNGEYDYYGLAKRVHCHLREALDRRFVQAIQVTQRGRVIILSGALPSTEILQQLTQLVANVPDVDTVEAYAVQVGAECLVSA